MWKVIRNLFFKSLKYDDFLANFFISQEKKSYKIGIITTKKFKGEKFSCISPNLDDEAITKEISKCSLVITSSKRWQVVADSFKIPNALVEDSEITESILSSKKILSLRNSYKKPRFLRIKQLFFVFKKTKEKLSSLPRKNKYHFFFSLIFIICFTIITLVSIFINGWNPTSMRFAILPVVFLAIIIFIFAPVVFHKLSQVDEKKSKFIIVIIAGLLLTFQALVISSLSVQQTITSWEDPLHTNTIAHDYATGTPVEVEHFEYIERFPFNLFIVKFYQFIEMAGKNIGILNYINYYQLFMFVNAFVIDLSIVLGILSIRKLWGRKATLPGTALFGVMSIPILLYTPFCYTDTLSMPFIVGTFYLLLHFKQFEKTGVLKKLLYGILIGVLCFLAVNIKVTSAIFIIALVLLFVPKMIKNLFITLSALIVFAIPTVAWKNYQSSVLDPSKQVPITHWVMMGVSGNGNWTPADYFITFAAIKDGHDVVAMNTDAIQYRLQKAGPTGILQLLGRKIAFVWSDGLFYAPFKLSHGLENPDSFMAQLFSLNGRLFKNIEILFNAVWLAAFLFILTFALRTFKAKESIFILLIKLTMVGIFTFYLIWETRSRYLINFLPLIIILTFYSIRGIATIRYQDQVQECLLPEKE